MAKCIHCGRTGGVSLSKDKKYCKLCTEEVHMNAESLTSDKAGTENANPSDDLVLCMKDVTESMEKKFDMLRTDLKSDLKNDLIKIKSVERIL